MNKEKALETLRKVMLAANRAGITHAHFIAFGTLLGAVRDAGPILEDHDNDVGILSDRVTAEQEMAYYNEIDKQGLFSSRRAEQKRSDNGRFTWFSCREKDDSVKCCNWFWILHNGYYWHSKGLIWIGTVGHRLKPPITTGEAILKGIKKELLEELIPIDFCGIKVNIPKRAGEVLDIWYPGWLHKENVSSREDILMHIPSWKDKSMWRIWKK